MKTYARVILAVSFGTIFNACVFANPKGEESKTMANATDEKLILEARWGELSASASNNRKATCTIKRSHPRVANRLVELDKLVTEAAKQPMITAYHIVAQIPSFEVFVYEPATGTRTLIYEDYSVLKSRQSEATTQLVALSKELCPL